MGEPAALEHEDTMQALKVALLLSSPSPSSFERRKIKASGGEGIQYEDFEEKEEKSLFSIRVRNVSRPDGGNLSVLLYCACSSLWICTATASASRAGSSGAG